MFDFVNWSIELISAMFFVSGFFVTYYQLRGFMATRVDATTLSGRFKATLVQTGFVLLLTGFCLSAAYFDPTNLAGYLNWSLFILIIPLIDERIGNVELLIRGLMVIIFWLIRINMHDTFALVSTVSISILLLFIWMERRIVQNTISYRLGVGIWAATAFWLTQTQLSGTNQLMNGIMFIIINIFSLIYWSSARLDELERMRLVHQVNSDTLTGAGSYFAFKDDLYLKIRDAKTSSQPLTIAMYDLDYFKHVNDRYGHQAGNDTLQQVTAAVQAELTNFAPQSAKLYRTGGEEFNIVFVGMTVTDVHDICLQILQRVRQTTVQTEAQHVNVTLSMGVTSLQSTDDSFEDLCERADTLLYHSKQNGRNQISFDEQ